MSDASQYDTIKENLLQSNTLYIDQEFQANIGEIFGELLQNEALEGGIDLDRVELLRAKVMILAIFIMFLVVVKKIHRWIYWIRDNAIFVAFRKLYFRPRSVS